MVMLETPSRVWRRIHAAEGADMPSLPSLPALDDSAENESADSEHLSTIYSRKMAPIHSTPPAILHTATSAGQLPSSMSSTARFASSIASRSASQRQASLSGPASVTGIQESFDVSLIPALPDGSDEDQLGHEGRRYASPGSVPDAYLPTEEDDDAEQDFSLTEALESVSRAGSPSPQHELPDLENEATPKKAYDYSVSLRSELKVCSSPFESLYIY
jgi:hypothetical protein